MWAWTKWLIDKINPEVNIPTTVIIADTTHCMAERIGDDIELLLIINGHVEHSAEQAEVKISLRDHASLQEICGILTILCPRIDRNTALEICDVDKNSGRSK